MSIEWNKVYFTLQVFFLTEAKLINVNIFYNEMFGGEESTEREKKKRKWWFVANIGNIIISNCKNKQTYSKYFDITVNVLKNYLVYSGLQVYFTLCHFPPEMGNAFLGSRQYTWTVCMLWQGRILVTDVIEGSVIASE